MTWSGYPEEDPALYEAMGLREQPEPTTEELCEADGHPYYGNEANCLDGKLHEPGEPCTCGACYCGLVRYHRSGAPWGAS